MISLDANGATPRLVNQITAQGGDYNIALKQNQKTLQKYAIKAFDEYRSDTLTYVTEETGHGRQEKRIYQQLSVDGLDLSYTQGWPRVKEKWDNLRCFGRVTSERRIHLEGKIEVQSETRYYFTSMKRGVQKWAQATRSHWGIENKLHWTLDVEFGEDQNRTRVGHAAENLALVRKMVLNLLKTNCPEKKSIRRKRLKCSFDDRYALKILTGMAFI